jgi:D-alanyl-D-alanine carboxypeptidase
MTTTLTTQQNRQELQKTIDDIVESGFLGVQLHVHDDHGDWTASAGTTELGRTTSPPANTHVRIGSNTKTFTATLTLQLVAEGRLGLDDPAAHHLPGLGIDPRTTVRMLLQHTSGIFNFSGEVLDDGTIAPGIPIPYGTAGTQWLHTRFTHHQPHDLAELALSKPRRFEPGTGWSYSNTNYLLLRLLIENLTGSTFADELHRLILNPLGLPGTLVPTTADIPEPHLHAYYRHDDTTVDVTRHDPTWNSSGGDMISTAHDLHTFITALTSGDLLPHHLLTQMCTPYPTGIPTMDYGLGVFLLTTDNGDTVISHNGATVGNAALMYSTPDGSKTLTAALNCVDDATMTIATAFRTAQHTLLNQVF